MKHYTKFKKWTSQFNPNLDTLMLFKAAVVSGFVCGLLITCALFVFPNVEEMNEVTLLMSGYFFFIRVSALLELGLMQDMHDKETVRYYATRCLDAVLFLEGNLMLKLLRKLKLIK